MTCPRSKETKAEHEEIGRLMERLPLFVIEQTSSAFYIYIYPPGEIHRCYEADTLLEVLRQAVGDK